MKEKTLEPAERSACITPDRAREQQAPGAPDPIPCSELDQQKRAEIAGQPGEVVRENAGCG